LSITSINQSIMKASKASSVIKRVKVTSVASYIRPLPEEMTFHKADSVSIDLDSVYQSQPQKLFDISSIYNKSDLPKYSVLCSPQMNLSNMLLSASSDDSATDSDTDSEQEETDVFSRQGHRSRKHDYEESDDEDNDFFGGIMIPIPKIPWPFQVGTKPSGSTF